MEDNVKAPHEVFFTCYRSAVQIVKRKDSVRSMAVAMVTSYKYYAEMEKRFLHVLEYLEGKAIEAELARGKGKIQELVNEIGSLRATIIKNQEFYKNILKPNPDYNSIMQNCQY